MNDSISEKIRCRLLEIEQAHSVRILFAVESGSRAWGFASPDSDYDVRFVYCHSRDWYLSVQERNDVIELPIIDELDIGGWDIRKALSLFAKSNPALLEWIKSPVTYLEQGEFRTILRRLEAEYFSPKRCLFHYLNQAGHLYREYLGKDAVSLKKYCYVLRSLLAGRYVERNAAPPPLEFEELLQSEWPDAADLRNSIAALIGQKKHGVESAEGNSIPSIDAWIEQTIDHLEIAARAAEARKGPLDPLDDVFRGQLF